MKQSLPMALACVIVGGLLYAIPDNTQKPASGPDTPTSVQAEPEPVDRPNVLLVEPSEPVAIPQMDLRPVPLDEPLPVQAEPVAFVPPLAKPQTASVQVVDWRPDTSGFTGAIVYGAEWCKFCHLLDGHLHHVAARKETGSWKFATTSQTNWKGADWVGHDCTEHGPKGLPLVEFYVAGQLVDSMRGYDGTTDRLRTIWNLHPRTRNRDRKPYQTSQRAKPVKATPASYVRNVNVELGESSDAFADAVAAPASSTRIGGDSGGKVQVEVSGTLKLEGASQSYSSQSQSQPATTRTRTVYVERPASYVLASSYATDTNCSLSYTQAVAPVSYSSTTYSYPAFYSYSQPTTTVTYSQPASYATSYRVGPVAYSYPAGSGTFTSYRRGLFWNRTSSIGPGGYSYQYNGLLSGTRGFSYSTGGGAYGTQRNCANGVCW